MKNKIMLLFIVLFITSNVKAQCEASSLVNASPVTLNNTGSQEVFGAIITNEYVVLNNLIIDDTYLITAQDLSAPSSEAFITLRNTSDNSVIAFGSTPLMFTTNVSEIEVHFFDESDCATTFDFAILSIQNNSTLEIENKELIEYTIFPNPVLNKLNILSSKAITGFYLFNVSGVKVMELNTNIKSLELNLKNLNPGLYFVHLKTGTNQSVTSKIIKK